MYIKIGFHKMETTVFKIIPIILCVVNTNMELLQFVADRFVELFGL